FGGGPQPRGRRVAGTRQAGGGAGGVRGVFSDQPAVGGARSEQCGLAKRFGGGPQPRGRRVAGARQAGGGAGGVRGVLSGKRVGWRCELAAAHSRVGDVLQAQGKLAEAQAAFGEGLAISRRLAEQDPSNAGWQRDLAVAHSRVGDVLQAQGKLAEAQAAFGEYLAVTRRACDPIWRRPTAAWATCCRRKASWRRRRRRLGRV